MMVMEGSKMSKTEYDLKAICILPMTHPINCTIQPTLPTNNEGRPMHQFKCPLAWFKWRAGSPLFDFVLFFREGGGGGGGGGAA